MKEGGEEQGKGGKRKSREWPEGRGRRPRPSLEGGAEGGNFLFQLSTISTRGMEWIGVRVD